MKTKQRNIVADINPERRKRMNKLLTAIFTVVLLGSLILVGCGGPTETTSPTQTTSPTTTISPDEPIELKFSYHTPPQASLVGAMFQPWTKSIEEATGGRVKITHYPGGTLVSLTDHYDAVVSGLVDIAMVEPDITPGRFPLSEFNLLPFTFPNGAVGARVNYEILEKYAFDTEWSEVKVLMTPALPPMNYHGTKPVQVIEDFQGLKIRSGGKVEGWIIEALGATSVEFETGDLSTSLERGLVDGAWLTHSAVNAFGVRDVTQYRTLVGLFPRAWVIIMNLQTWESLPADIKQAFEENSGAEASAQYCFENDKMIEATGRGLSIFDEQVGNPGFYTLPDEEKERWKEAVLPIWERWIEDVEGKGLPGRAMLEEALGLIEQYKDLYKPEEPPTPTDQTEAPPTLKPGQIYWDQVQDHDGETLTVFGPVVAINDLSDRAETKKLMVGLEEGGFQIDIANDVESLFPPLESYVGKSIYVTGDLELNPFAGVYEMVITDPSAIEIVINWDEVEDYDGATLTVRGPVVAINDLSDRAETKKLLVGLEEGGFQIDIANNVESLFPALEGYVGEYIYVTGDLELNPFAGVYEMVITDPSAIVMGVSLRPALPAGHIYWDEAEDYVDETMTVCGPVVAINDLSDRAETKKLMVGLEEGGFQIDIANDVESLFPALESYIDKTICVTGVIELNPFAGVYEMVITDPSAIDIVINWDEVEDYDGETLTVRGPVVAINDLSDRAGTKKLLVGLEEGGFQVDIANDVESLFPPLDDYVGEYIYVTGLVELNPFAGVYEMVITDPSAIEIAE